MLVDFGSQTAHLIARRVKDLGVDVEIVDPKNVLIAIQKLHPSGLIFSGGPDFVSRPTSPTIDRSVFDLHIPILGICYGWQLTAHLLGGTVVDGHREYGPTSIRITKKSSLFERIAAKELQVWMSHGDEVVSLPKGFDYYASSEHVHAAGAGDSKRKIYGIQFHPEVEHTQEGNRILRNFVEGVCEESVKLRKIRVEEVIAAVRETVDGGGKGVRAIAAVSGGVDSTVASAIVAAAIGKRFVPIFCDNGLMRVGTAEEVEYIFAKLLKVKPVILACQKEFLSALKGVIDPEQKRHIIGELYIKLFERVAKREKNIAFLVQGTIYSDVIESKGSKNASKIKSHHNVGGLPKTMQYTLLEPLRNFYKDEVRELGRQLGLPKAVLMKQPFPGPGQAIRILGEVTAERLAKQQQADQIVLEVIKQTGWYEKVFQSFPIMTGAKSTAVKGDGRMYGELVGLRVYDSSDIMTAGWTHLPYDVLQQISSRIVNEVPGVSRVVYDITTKPPATMEWE